jgi:NADH-quinone oxidoreductase subunit L
MVARCSIIFVSAPAVLTVIAVVGLLTALFAATVGLVQNDIKKVLAYSTISQLGYMFLALGVGAFSAGIFHVMTHAFFKALLFLGAGSVIHAMHEEQNIQNYGGLKKYMPKTAITFLIAALAISGIPPFSGFFSKDEILWYAYSQGNTLFWIIGVVTALLTAFYMFRLYYLTFEGKERFGHSKHPHESPLVMTVPLIVLAILSAIGGFVGVPEVFSGEHGNLFHNWLAPVFQDAERKLDIYGLHTHFEEILLMVLSVAGAAMSIYGARYIYLNKLSLAEKFSLKFKRSYKILQNKYYVDEAYDKVIINPMLKGSEKVLWNIADNWLIDGIVNGTASVITSLSQSFKRIQTGVTQFYAVIMLTGIAVALLWLIISLQ